MGSKIQKTGFVHLIFFHQQRNKHQKERRAENLERDESKGTRDFPKLLLHSNFFVHKFCVSEDLQKLSKFCVFCNIRVLGG
jgi:hypothetical protein